ncbi:hypothetical protein Pcinc_023258 [Petrolisthes cinctipes]|uniref:Anaphase-promoting complex subunit 4-like WD40 domain-containing protein n=1 Tax=Petrolisthes cinctipes TaxID=88211 RepID=A0AAE1FCW9_PETCI|nr:hypothetical protein Pcinc_023258 [Petrolisthes cinctipes]
MSDIVGCRSILVIQSDWHDSLRNNDTSAWIYYKRRGEPAQYDKIGGTATSDTFQVQSRTERTISVKHQPSSLSTVFIAPVATFSGIHSKSVISLGVGEGGLGVSVCTDNKLHVWETQTGIVRRTLAGHLFDVYTCQLFPSGVVVLSGGGDMQLRIWDAVTGSCPVVLQGHVGAVLDAAVVDRGKNIISVSKDGTARLWNCGEGKCIATLLSVESVINCCALTNVTDAISLPHLEEEPDDLEHSTSGKLLLVGCEDGSAHLLGVECRKVLNSFTFGAAVLCVCWATPTRGVVGLSDGQLMVVDATSHTTHLLAHNSASPVESLSPYTIGIRERKVVGVLAGRRDGVCQFYQIDTSADSMLTNLYQLTGSDCDPVYSIATDLDHIYLACRDGCIRKYCRRDLRL